MRLVRFVVFFMGAFAAMLYSASAETYELSKTEDGYKVEADFFIDATIGRVIDTIYNFEHLKKFAKSATSIELLRQDGNLQEVKFIYKNFFSEIESTYYRKLLKEEHRIIFELKDYKCHGLFSPSVISSKGYYAFEETNGGCLVKYFEECKLKDGNLNWFYFFQAERESKTFFKEMKECVESKCLKDKRDKRIKGTE